MISFEQAVKRETRSGIESYLFLVMMSQAVPEIKFVADVMLGSLAKWLRILGYDTVYLRRAPDIQLQEITWRENRVLLSRDHELVQGIHPRHALYIASTRLPEQLRQVVRAFRLDRNIHLFSICTRCNVPVQPIERDKIRGRVPEYVAENYREFYICPSCHQVFWPGTHKQKAIEWLREKDVVRI